MKPDRDYICRAIFIDPYGNKTELSPIAFSTKLPGKRSITERILPMKETASEQEAEGKREDTYGDKRITQEQPEVIWEPEDHRGSTGKRHDVW